MPCPKISDHASTLFFNLFRMSFSSKGSDPSVYVLLYMFVPHSSPRQLCRVAISHKPFDSIHTYAYRSYTSPLSSLTPQLQAIFADSAIVCPLIKASFSRCYDSAKTACLTLCYNKRKFMPHPILCQYGIGRMVVHIAKSSRNYIIRGHCQKLIIEIYT